VTLRAVVQLPSRSIPVCYERVLSFSTAFPTTSQHVDSITKVVIVNPTQRIDYNTLTLLQN
jgi:hypothetical protein